MTPFVQPDDVDSIFKDKGPNLGSDPFALNENALQVIQEPITGGEGNECHELKLARLISAHELSYEAFIGAILSVLQSAAHAGACVFLENKLSTGVLSVRMRTGDESAAFAPAGKRELKIVIRGFVYGVVELYNEGVDTGGQRTDLLANLVQIAACVIENRLVIAKLTRCTAVTNPQVELKAA